TLLMFYQESVTTVLELSTLLTTGHPGIIGSMTHNFMLRQLRGSRPFARPMCFNTSRKAPLRTIPYTGINEKFSSMYQGPEAFRRELAAFSQSLDRFESKLVALHIHLGDIQTQRLIRAENRRK